MPSPKASVRRDLPPEALPPFPGFGPAGLGFLRGLAANNDRAWFEAHRAAYESELRTPMESLMAELAAALARRRIPLGGDPRRAVFRIHRDVRFSRDKSPYKTHVGAVLAREGKQPGSGVLYVHVEPGACFAACGFYQPQPPALEAIRRAMAAKPAVFKRMLASLAASGLALSPDEEALKRPPRGFEGVADPVPAEHLRRRSFVIRRPLTEAEVGRAALVEDLAGFAEAAAPLLRFGWAASGA